MNSKPARQWARRLERAAALALGGVLLTSAVGHFGNPYRFLSTVYSYQIVGAGTGRVIAATLPTTQIALALCLVLRWWPAGTYRAAIGLFVAFLVAQSSARARGLDISCGCFGGDASLPIGPGTLIVAGACAGASAVGLILTRLSDGREQGSEPCGTAEGAVSR